MDKDAQTKAIEKWLRMVDIRRNDRYNGPLVALN